MEFTKDFFVTLAITLVFSFFVLGLISFVYWSIPNLGAVRVCIAISLLIAAAVAFGEEVNR